MLYTKIKPQRFLGSGEEVLSTEPFDQIVNILSTEIPA